MASDQSPETNVPTLEDVALRMSATYMTVGEMVLAVLREAVVSGALRPGERLRQEALAEAIGVSRIPVRSALMQLESEGLVTFHPHRGAVVRQLTPERASETYRLRALLEAHGLERSIATMTDERAKRLLALADNLDDPQRSAQFVEDRMTFYRELYDAPNNPVLIDVVEQLRSSVGRDLLGLRVDRPLGHHRELADVAVSGDVDRARELLTAHLDHVCEQLLAVLARESSDE